MGIRDSAAAICEHLSKQGISASLVGGACVSIYTDNAYESFDLDFVSAAPHKVIEKALSDIGFKKTPGRHFDHPDCKYYAEFVTPPVAIGDEIIRKLKRLRTPQGFLNLLTPLDCVKDRLAAYVHWKDTQALEQAVMVAKRHKIPLAKLKAWAVREGGKSAFEHFLERLKPVKISAKTLKDIDSSMANLKKGRVSKPIDLGEQSKKVRKSSN